MGSSIKLDMDEKGKPVDQTKYRGMVSSLLYLTTSIPDIMYSVCFYARFQACPKESHLKVVKRIFRYLKGIIDNGLWCGDPRDRPDPFGWIRTETPGTPCYHSITQNHIVAEAISKLGKPINIYI